VVIQLVSTLESKECLSGQPLLVLLETQANSPRDFMSIFTKGISQSTSAARYFGDLAS
jgi:hypothetical protein